MTRKGKSKFPFVRLKSEFMEIVEQTDKKTLAVWSIECVERVMPYFEKEYPNDRRPRKAIETLQRWIETGEFRMTIIREASLSSHAAAREVGEDNPSRSVARAAGQAVATAHVSMHSIGGAIYALQAIYRTSDASEADLTVAKELEWQLQRLNELKKGAMM